MRPLQRYDVVEVEVTRLSKELSQKRAVPQATFDLAVIALLEGNGCQTLAQQDFMSGIQAITIVVYPVLPVVAVVVGDGLGEGRPG